MTLFCRKLKTDPATLAPIIPYLLSFTCRSPVGRGDVETDPGGGCQLEPVLANSASADTGSVLKFTGKKITIKSSVAEPKLFNFGSGYTAPNSSLLWLRLYFQPYITTLKCIITVVT